jgi:hypothetical protein
MLTYKLANGLYQARTYGYHAKPIASTRNEAMNSMFEIIKYWRNLEAHNN